MLPWLGELNDSGFTANIFQAHQNSNIDPAVELARSSLTAAINSANFINAFDPNFTGRMSRKTLYQQLRLSLGADLTHEQIAQVVDDVVRQAHIADKDAMNCKDWDDLQVSVDEFCHFMSPAECDLYNVALKYRLHPGNPEVCALLEQEDDDPTTNEYLHKLQRECLNMEKLNEETEDRVKNIVKHKKTGKKWRKKWTGVKSSIGGSPMLVSSLAHFWLAEIVVLSCRLHKSTLCCTWFIHE